MKPATPRKPNLAVSLICLNLLLFASSASAQLTIATDNQQGGPPFMPTWTVDQADSLINGLSPTTATGNFSQEVTGRNVNSLTVNTDLTISQVNGSVSTNYVSCGGGNNIIYSLPASTYGYDITNITVFSGWQDGGRDAQRYVVLYSTVSDPTHFYYLTSVNYNPSGISSAPANRVVITDASGAAIATNVAALWFDFADASAENGWAGLAAITVGGTAAADLQFQPPPVSLTYETETGASPFTPSWTVEMPSLIAGMEPSTATGNLTQEGATGAFVLTDGLLGASGDVTGFATCGASGGGTLIYTLTNSANGYDITNIVTYSGWGDGGRDGQYYTVSYSTVAARTTYIPIATVFYNPAGISDAPANRVVIAKADGTPLATGVFNLKFDFSSPTFAANFDNGYQGFSEIIAQGTETTAPPPPSSPVLTQDTLPTYAETVVGEQVIFTAAFSNSPPAKLQWQFIGGGMTNDISAATNETLTLNDVQLADSGSYRLKAVNATNSLAAPSYSQAVPLVVNSVPDAINGVIVRYAGQCGAGASGSSTNFVPTWTVNTNGDLIYGYQIGFGPGTSTPGTGNFGLNQSYGDPTILTDGTVGSLNYWPGVGSSLSLVTCGPGGSAGLSMTYSLETNSAPNGFDLTNIVVYGGWGDAGRDEQKYQVLYSTVANPTVFNSLVTADYNPSNPNATQSATRTSLVPETGAALAQNVAAVQINWNLQGASPENGYEGYSEIVVKGTPSAPKPVLTQDITPLTAKDAVGSTITMKADFSGATSYQWQKDGTNISGATTPTLTLTNLKLSDTATNGGYRLVASNSSGTATTRPCAVIVYPVPAAVGNAVTAFAFQTSDQSSFSPTWDTNDFGSSLLAYAYPINYGTGDFNDPDANPNSHDLAGGLPVLTDLDYGTIIDGGSHPAFATCGTSAGQFVTYALPSDPNGYDVTNIVIASGWNDAGRDAEWSTILYSTVANPTTFIPLAVVTNNPSVSTKSVIRATITPVAGALASNVYAIKADFTSPPGIENGYCGFSQINVFGSPSAAPTFPIGVTTESQNTDTPSWTVETPNLIASQLPSSVGPGAYAGGFNNEPATEGLPALTDGTLGPSGMGNTNFATCGGAYGAGSSVTYTSTSGWDITNIVVYSGWGNYDRDGQFYDISYSTLIAPTTFNPLTSVDYNPLAGFGPAVNRVQIAPINGATALATNVYAVKFDFSRQGTQDNGYSGYSEIVLQGSNLEAVFSPTVDVPAVLGANLVLTGRGGTPDRSYSVLSTTNLLAPLDSWTVTATGVLDAGGAFSNAIPITTSEPERFFQIRIP